PAAPPAGPGVQPAGAQVAPAFAPEAAPAAAAAPATATEMPPHMRPAGVAHGTPSGNRLRPEDAVATDAQFEGQRAVLERRKLIDELVATGVPAVTASQVGRPRAPYLAVLYLLIPLVVVGVLLSQNEPSSSEPSGEGPTAEQPGDGGGGAGDVTLVAQNIQFDTDTISLPAERDVVVTLDNQDTAPHNFALYPDEAAGASQSDAIFQGENVDPAQTVDYSFSAPEPGEYYFQCDVHPAMNGVAEVR
ncbi:MAG TPA: cupredoxin domain-containing protein, partial [Actinomycetota bacterium]|nr:cupredoxin domain-containing protein [Actinomycetota bacterium]